MNRTLLILVIFFSSLSSMKRVPEWDEEGFKLARLRIGMNLKKVKIKKQKTIDLDLIEQKKIKHPSPMLEALKRFVKKQRACNEDDNS